jgi:hypothetical protein
MTTPEIEIQLPIESRWWRGLSDGLREEWRQWMRRHGLDTRRVMIPNVLIINPDKRQVSAACFVLDDHDQYVAGPTGLVLELVTAQLDFEPLPCPRTTDPKPADQEDTPT